VAFLTPELLDEKPIAEIQRAMFKDIVAVQKRVGTRDVFFVAVQGLPLKNNKKVSLVIVGPMKDDVADWYARFHDAKPKAKLLAQGTCSFVKGADKNIVVQLKKITGGGARKAVVDAVTKGLSKEARFSVKDSQVRGKPKPDGESGESEDEERG